METRTAKPVAFRQFGKQFAEGSKISVSEAFEEAGLNYNVTSEPLVRIPEHVLEAFQNGQIPIWKPNPADVIQTHRATMREDTNTTLGVVGRDYGIVQNQNAFGFFDFLAEVSGTQPQIVSAGTLGVGERIFLSARLGENTYLSPNDAVTQYVVFTNGHDGKNSLMAFFTPVRVICQNTLNMAIHNCPNKIVFKHSKYVGQRVDWEDVERRRQAVEIFAKSVKFSEKFTENMAALAAQPVTPQYAEDFAAQMILTPAQFTLYKQAGRQVERVEEISTRSQNLLLSLKDSIQNGVGQDYGRGTKAWLLNGVTTWLHNERTYKTPEDEFRSAMEGDAAKKTQKAYDLLTKAA